MMKRIRWTMIGLVFLAVGCHSLGWRGLTDTPTVGQPVQSVIAAHAGEWLEYFDANGSKAPELPKTAGSVSVHRADGTGQDNYTFDANGVITRHQRSYGDDYSRGFWGEAK